MNRKIFKIAGIVVGALILLALMAYGILWWAVTPKIPSPKSDVPIEYKIAWWAYQEAVLLDSLDAKVTFDGLNLFNGTAVVEYRLKGNVSYKSSWRPYIKAVNISERWEGVNENSDRLGSIVVTPIVAVENDEGYSGESIDFDIVVQDYLDSGGWGANIYQIQSLNKKVEIELVQRK